MSRSLRDDAAWCARAWRCGPGSGPGPDPGAAWRRTWDSPQHEELAVAIGFASSTAKNVKSKLLQYGHVWDAVYTFYRCVVRPHLWARNNNRTGRPGTLRVYIPAVLNVTRRFSTPSAFDVLQVLLSGAGSGVAIERVPWVPICGAGSQGDPYRLEKYPCCLHSVRLPAAAASLAAGAAAAATPSPPPVRVMQLTVDEARRVQPIPIAELRSVVWANVGATPPRAAGGAGRVALFASSQRAANNRHIVDEAELVEACRAYFAAHHPSLPFLHQRLQDLPYEEELRLLRRAHVFIALFGSGLHNCRFLPPGALVIELRGAMGGEYSNLQGYSVLCAFEARHRWLGFAAENAAPARVSWHAERKAYDLEFANRRDPGWARFNVPAFVASLEAAMRGEYAAVIERYVANATAWPLHPGVVRSRETLAVSWRSNLLRLPQYQRL